MLAFCNGVREDIWVSYMFYSPEDCGGDGGNWQAIGWFRVSPGQCSTGYAHDLDDGNNRYWYYYAESDSGRLKWAGPIATWISDEAFNVCRGVANSTQFPVGFRQFDVGDADNFTMTLVE